MATNDRFVLNEHFESTAWLDELPDGMISDLFDLRFNVISLEQDEQGCTLYIGPINPEEGGSAVTIRLSNTLSLIDYEIEHLAPVPKL